MPLSTILNYLLTNKQGNDTSDPWPDTNQMPSSNFPRAEGRGQYTYDPASVLNQMLDRQGTPMHPNEVGAVQNQEMQQAMHDLAQRAGGFEKLKTPSFK